MFHKYHPYLSLVDDEDSLLLSFHLGDITCNHMLIGSKLFLLQQGPDYMSHESSYKASAQAKLNFPIKQ